MADSKRLDFQFSEIERDDVFTEAFVEDILPDLLNNAAFEQMRSALDGNDSIWGTPANSSAALVHDAATELLKTIQTTKSRPDAMSEKDKTRILNGYRNVYRAMKEAMSVTSIQAKAETQRLEREARAITSETNKVIREASAAEAEMHRYNKSLHDLEVAKKRVDETQRKQAQQLAQKQKRLSQLKPISGSVPIPDSQKPNIPGINFVLPYRSSFTDHNIKSTKAKAAPAAPIYKSATFMTPASLKKFQSQKTSRKILPFQVNAADHARGVEYQFQGKHGAELAKIAGTTFHSASKTGAVPRNARLETGAKYSPAAAYGTAMHGLFELMDQGGLSVRDIQRMVPELKKDPIYAPAFKRGSWLPALRQREAVLRGGTEETLFNEQGVGGVLKVHGVNQNRTATIDRLYRNRATGEMILEDYKNEKRLKPWEHFTQLAAEAALYNANQGLIRDNQGRVIPAGAPITKGRVAKYDSNTGRQEFTYFDLGSSEDYLKYLELQEDLNSGKITEAQFFSKLPAPYQKAYSDSYGAVRRRAVGDVNGEGANWLEVKLGNGDYSSVLFDEHAKPTKTNSLFNLWKKDPVAARKAIQAAFRDPLVPLEYKQNLYWKAHKGSQAIYGETAVGGDVESMHEFYAMLKGELSPGIITDPRYAERVRREQERMEHNKQYNKDFLQDWFVPKSTIKSRSDKEHPDPLGNYEMDLPESGYNAWQKSTGIRSAFFTMKQFHPSLFGKRMGDLLDLIRQREANPHMSPDELAEYSSKKQELMRALLGEADTQDIQDFLNLTGNNEETITNAQSAYQAMIYEAQAEGSNLDYDSALDKIAGSPDDVLGVGDKLWMSYLAFRDRILKGYIPQDISPEDRQRIARAFDNYLAPVSKDTIDLIGTLTGGMSRLRASYDIYDILEKRGVKLTPEQLKEKGFGAYIKQEMDALAASGEEIPASEFFMNFGNKLLGKYATFGPDGRADIDTEALENDYGEYAADWLLRYARFSRSPQYFDEAELEQRMAEAFALDKRGNLAAYSRFYKKNEGYDIPHTGLSGIDLIASGIPLSALKLNRGDYDEEDAGSWSEWGLFNADYTDMLKKAWERFDAPEVIPEESKPAVVEAVEERVAEAVSEAVESVTDEVVDNFAKESEKTAKAKRARKKSPGGKKKKAAAPKEAEPAAEEPKAVVPSAIEIAGGNVTVTGSTVIVNGSPVNINNIENGQVYNDGSGPITQNIHTTGNVIIQGGGPGGGFGGGAIGGSPLGDLPLAQQYEYYSGRRLALQSQMGKEIDTTKKLELYGAKYINEIAARTAKIGRMTDDLTELEKKLAEIADLGKTIVGFDEIKKEIDSRYAERGKLLDEERAIALGKRADAEAKLQSQEQYKDYKELEKLYGERSDLRKKALEDARHYDLSTSSKEKRALSDVNEARLQELRLLQARIDAYKTGSSLEADDIGSLERKASAMDSLNALSINAKSKGLTNVWESFASSINTTFQRFMQFGLVYKILGKIKQGISQVVQMAKQLDKVETNLRIVTGENREEADRMMTTYGELAKNLASTTTEVATAATEWLRQGYKVSEVNDLVTSSIKLATLGMMSASDATKALTSAMKGFKIESSSIDTIVDKFTALDMAAATTAGDIATALSKFAATAQMSGMNIDQAAAMATTIMDVSQNDAGAVGNAVKTMLSRFGNVKAGAFTELGSSETSEDLGNINDIERVLGAIGIKVRSSAKEMRDFGDVLADIADKWDTLDKVSQNAIATAMAGTRQRESFAVLMNNYDKYEELLEVSENSFGTADKKYQSYLEGLEASQKRIQTAWESLAKNSELNTFMTTINNMLAGAMEALPVIIRYVTRLIAVTQSYKIPQILASFTPTAAMMSGAQGYFGGLKEASGAKGKLGYVFGGSQRKKIESYYEKNGGEGGMFSQLKKNFTDLSTAAKHAAERLEEAAHAGHEAAEADRDEASASRESAAATPGGAPGTASRTPDDTANTVVARSKGMSPKTKARWGKAAMAAAAGVTGFLTADTTQRDWATGEVHESSGTAATVSRVTTGAAAAIGAIWGPIVSMLASTAMDALNKYFIGPLIDFEGNKLNAYVNQRQKEYEVLVSIKNDVSDIVSFASLDLTTATNEQLAQMNDTLIEFLDTMYADTDEARAAREGLTKYAIEILKNQGLGIDENSSLNDIINAYMNSDADTKRKIARALQAAQSEQSAFTKYETYASERRDRFKSLDDFLTFVGYTKQGKIGEDGLYRYTGRYGAKPTGWEGNEFTFSSYEEMKALLASLYNMGIIQSPDATKTFKGLNDIVVTYYGGVSSSLDYADAIVQIKDLLAEQLTLDGENNQATIQYLKQLLKEMQDAQYAQDRVFKELNEGRIQAALQTATIGSGKFLLDATTDELKELGLDQIVDLIAGALGYMEGGRLYQDGQVTDKAYDTIVEALREAGLSSLISGQSYTIDELARMDKTKRPREYQRLVEFFSSALNITANELEEQLQDPNSELRQKFGSVSLGDFLSTSDDLSEHISTLTSLFEKLVSATGLTVENLQDIIRSSPQYLKYVGDAQGMLKAIFSDLGTYTAVLSKSLYREMMTTTGVGTEYKNDLYYSGFLTDAEAAALKSSDFGDAENLEAMMEALVDPMNGLAPELAEKVLNHMKDYIGKIDPEKMVRKWEAEQISNYLQKDLERQVEALNKQKEALQQINKQREYENKLIEARNKLEEAGKEKKRVWREGVGWVYEADQEAIKEAQKNLDEVQNERQIKELELQIEQLQAYKDFLAKMPDEVAFENLKNAYNEWVESNDATILSLTSIMDKIQKMYKGEDEEIPNPEEEGSGSSFEDQFEGEVSTKTAEANPSSGGGGSSATAGKTNILDKIVDLWTVRAQQAGALAEMRDKGEDTTEGYYNKQTELYNTDKALWNYLQQLQQDKPELFEEVIRRLVNDGVDLKNDPLGAPLATMLNGMALTSAMANANTDNKRRIRIDNDDYYIDMNTALNDDSPTVKHLQDDFVNGDSRKDMGHYWTADQVKDGKLLWSNWTDLTPEQRESFDKHYKRNLSNFLAHEKLQGAVIAGGTDDLAFVDPYDASVLHPIEKAALGSLGLAGGPTLINERGTEALITPYGTVTSLPSSTGVVPADITKNLWSLGEVAPSVIRLLEGGNPSLVEKLYGDQHSDLNIGVFNMNVTPNGDFDIDAWIKQVRSAIELRKNQ